MGYSVDLENFPLPFRQAYFKLPDAAKQKWLAERHRALTDHIYLANELMGMDFQEVPHKWLFAKMLQKNPGTPLYRLDDIKKKRMILWPRGTFKTSSVVVEIVQLILNYPDIRIAFLSGADVLAQNQLGRVKKVFEQPTKKFRELFPEFVGTNLGNMSKFNVPCQSLGRNYAEPTMAITTARSVKAGSHYDVIFVDDLVNETNYRSIKALQKAIQDYRDMTPLLAPAGFMYITGTRYSFGDLYEEIQEQAKREMAELGTNPWVISIKSCWVRLCKCGHSDAEHDFDSDPDGPCAAECKCRQFRDSGATAVLFPQFTKRDGNVEGHSVAFLQSEKVRAGSEFFACQYENNPIADGEQTFTDELIGKYTVWLPNQFPTDLQASCFVMGDLGYVGQEGRDSSVLYVVRYWQGRMYVIDSVAGNWDSMKVTEELFTVMFKHRPVIIYLEQFPAWESYQSNFTYYASDKKLQKLPISWLPGPNKKDAKLVRIGSIKGVMQQGRLWIYGHIPHYKVLVDQLKKWPKSGKHDDFADCLGWVCAAPIGSESATPNEDKSMVEGMSFIRRLIASQQKDTYDSRIVGSY